MQLAIPVNVAAFFPSFFEEFCLARIFLRTVA
jgi:hypothetical protein